MTINKHLHLNFSKCKSVICLNGDLPEKDFFTGKKVIAADGAANKLIAIGVRPEIVIGDLDSFDKSLALPTLEIKDQDTTDFEKCLDYAKKHKLMPTLICGAGGGKLDHIFHNIGIILQNNCMFYAPPIIGLSLTAPSTLDLSLKTNTKISIFGIKSIVSSSGLKWELKDNKLDFPESSSCLNRNIKENIAITCKSGKAIVMIYEEDQHDNGKLFTQAVDDLAANCLGSNEPINNEL